LLRLVLLALLAEVFAYLGKALLARLAALDLLNLILFNLPGLVAIEMLSAEGPLLVAVGLLDFADSLRTAFRLPR
jgi:hypothetical protein